MNAPMMRAGFALIALGGLAVLVGCEAGPDAAGPAGPPAPHRPDVEFIGDDAVVHNGGPGDTTATYQDGEYNEYAPVYSNRVQTLVTGYCLRTEWWLPKVNFVTESGVKSFRSYQVSAHVEKPEPVIEMPPPPQPAPPRIVLRKEADDVVCIGDNICYRIYFKNIGGSDAVNVTVEDVIPIAAELLMESAFSHPYFAEVEFVQDSNAEIRKIRFMIPGPVPPGHEGYVEFCIRLKERFPLLTAWKGGDLQKMVRDVASYQMRFTNEGTKDAYNLTVVDQLPNGTEFVSASAGGSYDPTSHRVTWPVPRIQHGGQDAFTPTLQLRGMQPGRTINSVHIESGRGIEAKASAETEWMKGVPNLMCRVTGPAQVRPNEGFPIGVEVTNTGNWEATNVMIRMTLPPQIAYNGNAGGVIEMPVAIVNAGQAVSQAFEVFQATAPGPFTLAVEVTNPESPPATCGIDILAAEVTLQIQKTGRPEEFVGQTGDYQITVTNAGSAVATALVLEDVIPPGERYVDGSASDGGQYDPASSRLAWNLGDLPPGGSRQVTYRATGVQPGTWVNPARAAAREHAVETDFTTVVKAVPAMQIQISDSADPVEVGGETTYTILVGNEGQAPTSEVQLTVQIDANEEFVSAVAPTGVTFEVQGKNVVFSPIPGMNPGDRLEFRVAVRVTAAGSLVCEALLRYREFSREVRSQEPTTGY
ncbi:MAG: DUF11 domain-containing protein [Planctomycetes bacterium]|nr:DUF11 domain-containing protein [Planctomycetota bacterium]